MVIRIYVCKGKATEVFHDFKQIVKAWGPGTTLGDLYEQWRKANG